MSELEKMNLVGEPSTEDWSIKMPPPLVGQYLFGQSPDRSYTSLAIGLPVKPSWLKRWMMKSLLGFEWRDGP